MIHKTCGNYKQYKTCAQSVLKIAQLVYFFVITYEKPKKSFVISKNFQQKLTFPESVAFPHEMLC